MSTTTTHYLGIALGPLVDTLTKAQKTRELWTASYLFSTLMKNIVELTESEKIGGCVLAPTKVNTPVKKLFGAGVYPDRFYAAFTLPMEMTDADGNPITTLESQQKAIFSTLKNIAVERTVETALPNIPAAVKKSWQQGEQEESLYNYWRSTATAFFADYFRITHVWLPAPDKGENILKPLNDLLDVQELQPAYQTREAQANALLQLLDKPYSSKMVRDGLVRNNNSTYTKLVGPVVGKDKKGPTFEFFPSTAQIASLGLFQEDEPNYQLLLSAIVEKLKAAPATKEDTSEDVEQEAVGSEPAATAPETDPYKEKDTPIEDQSFQQGTDDANANAAVLQEFYRQLDNKGEEPSAEKLAKHFEDYHKYFCVVDVDGDRFGKIIAAVGDDETNIQHFSKTLAGFAAEAAKIINAFGGKPIYIGGDDLLFFAPVVAKPNEKALRECEITFTEQTATVFDLIAAIDTCFEKFDFFPVGKTPENEKDLPSLSYGLTLSHYKFPLFEAREQSLAELYRSKNTKWGADREKNAISFRLIRHSGSYFSGSMSKDLMKKLNVKRSAQLQPGEKFLSSFTYKLRQLEPLFRALDAVNPEALTERREAIFDNFFDEEIHKDNPQALTAARKLFGAGMSVSATVYDKPLDPYDNLYAIMRLLAFTLPAKN